MVTFYPHNIRARGTQLTFLVVQYIHTMAKAQISGAVFQRTRDTLGKVINKPPLTDKLLGRPPFRFLHDIINEVHDYLWHTCFYCGCVLYR